MLIYHIRRKLYNSTLQATGGKTVALDIKFPDFSNNTAPLSFVANMGLAICHKEDNYNRKIGRELALSKLKVQEFKLAYCDGDNIVYSTYIDLGSILRKVSFSINKVDKRNRVTVQDINDSLEDIW